MSIPYDNVNQRTTPKQPNSRMCFVCGVENPAGLHAHFYQTDDRTCVGRFRPADQHQGYPGRVHGGVVAAMLDETLGRAVWGDQTTWGVTAELTIRYKTPVPLGQILTIVGRVTGENRRLFQAEGKLLLADGTVAVVAHGKFVKLSLQKIMAESPPDRGPSLELFVIPDEEEK